MSRSTRSFAIAPRLMTHFDLAVYLRRSEGWLKENLPSLVAEGLPSPDRLFDRHGLFDRAAVDAWLDRRAGLSAAPGAAPATGAIDLLQRIEDAEL